MHKRKIRKKIANAKAEKMRKKRVSTVSSTSNDDDTLSTNPPSTSVSSAQTPEKIPLPGPSMPQNNQRSNCSPTVPKTTPPLLPLSNTTKQALKLAPKRKTKAQQVNRSVTASLPSTAVEPPSLTFAIVLLYRFRPAVYRQQTDQFMAGVREQLSPDDLADPLGEDSGPHPFSTFVRILASGREEVRRGNAVRLETMLDTIEQLLYGHPDLHGGFILLVLYEFFLNEAHKALSGCKAVLAVDNSELRARVMTFCRAHEGMQEAMLRLSSPRHTFSFLAASMVFTLVAGEAENSKSTASTTEQLVVAERRQAAVAFSASSTSEQKKYARPCGAGDGSSKLANIEDYGFCQALKRSSVFSKTVKSSAKGHSPPPPPPPLPPPPQTPLPQTPKTLAEHDEKAQKILDFLLEVRSTDEVMFRATMSILFAYKEVIPGDELLFLAIYQELMALYRRHCPQLQSLYWRYFGLIHLQYRKSGDCSLQLLGEGEAPNEDYNRADSSDDHSAGIASYHANCPLSPTNEILLKVLTSASSGKKAYAIRECELCYGAFGTLEGVSTTAEEGEEEDGALVLKTKVVLPPNPAEFAEDYSDLEMEKVEQTAESEASKEEIGQVVEKEGVQVSVESVEISQMSKSKKKKLKKKKKTKVITTGESVCQLSDRLQAVLDLSGSD